MKGTDLGFCSYANSCLWDSFFFLHIGIISLRAALQALYHCGKLVELDVRQDPDSLQVRKQYKAVKLWRHSKMQKRVEELKVGDSERRKKDRLSRGGTDVKEG